VATISTPELFPLIVGLLGGLALFLFGLEQMTGALKAVAGDRLRLLLARLTVNRFAAVGTGAFVTAVIQSSSVTTVLVVSFVSSGVMSLSQSVGIILGANIGTTITAQIVAFHVTKLALLMVAAGFGLTFVASRETLRHHGTGIFGLGLVFLGMTVMGEAMTPLREYPPFLRGMTHMAHPALGILAGASFTALVQSSSATTGIVIAMASQGLIGLPGGIALILGANVGTCVTALLASIGKPHEALRASVVHVLFNVIGVLIWLPFLGPLADLVVRLSPKSPELSGLARLAAETPRQIANAHTLFNIANALIFLPFTTVLASLAERLVADRELAEEELIRARYLNGALLGTPTLALEQARREIVRAGEISERMLVAMLPAVLTGSRDALVEVEKMDRAVDALHEHIVSYLRKLGQGNLTEAETRELLHLMALANSIESASDVVETDLVSRGRQRLSGGVLISPPTQKMIGEFHECVVQALHGAVEAIGNRDPERAGEVVALKPVVQDLADRAAVHGANRLVTHEDRRLPTYAVEMDMIEDLRRVFYFAKRMAHGVIEFDRRSA
jgi:phosphate:Na+ symporter